MLEVTQMSNVFPTKLSIMRAMDYPIGFSISPMPITLGEEITILYYGLLYNSGADDIWLHYGYGDTNTWQNTKEIKMEKTSYGYAVKIRTTDPSRLNLCFRDSAYNWDNNNGTNWSIEIHNGQLM